MTQSTEPCRNPDVESGGKVVKGLNKKDRLTPFSNRRSTVTEDVVIGTGRMPRTASFGYTTLKFPMPIGQ
jgi:hypothetical protein